VDLVVFGVRNRTERRRGAGVAGANRARSIACLTFDDYYPGTGCEFLHVGAKELRYVDSDPQHASAPCLDFEDMLRAGRAQLAAFGEVSFVVLPKGGRKRRDLSTGFLAEIRTGGLRDPLFVAKDARVESMIGRAA